MIETRYRSGGRHVCPHCDKRKAASVAPGLIPWVQLLAALVTVARAITL